MPLSFFRDSITVKRAATTTKNGMQVFDWDHATTHTIDKIQIAGGGTSREYERTLNVSDSRTLRASYDADIQAGDRVIWNGDVYEVNGEVFHTKSPTGRVSSTRCQLVRWTG